MHFLALHDSNYKYDEDFCYDYYNEQQYDQEIYPWKRIT